MKNLLRSLSMVAAISLCSCATTQKAPRAIAVAPPSTPSTTSPCEPGALKMAPIRPQGALGNLDELFMSAYIDRRHAGLEADTPVLIVFGSDLILCRSGKEDRAPGIPDEYHALKAIAHTPFALYLRLAPGPGQVSGENAAAALQKFADRIDATRQDLSRWNLTPEQRDRQLAMLDASEHLARNALTGAMPDAATLGRFAAGVGPLMKENTFDAGCLQIEQTHRQTMKWKDELSSEEWQALRVINRGKHQARYRNAATQYYAWLLGGERTSWSYPGETLRVVYAEFMSPGENAMDIAASVSIDAAASKAFFGDAWRLSEDVLSDGATACIAKLSRPN